MDARDNGGGAGPWATNGQPNLSPLPSPGPSGASFAHPPAVPASLEVVRGTVVASGRQVTGGYVPPGGGPTTIHSTPELWVVQPDGTERRLLGDPLADARPGHEVAVVLGEESRFERVLCLVNLSTRTTTLAEPTDPERAAIRGTGDLIVHACLWSLALAVPVILATMSVVLELADALLPRHASEAVAGPAFQLGLLLVPVAGVWTARHRGRQDLARREARLAGVEGALAAAGIDLGLGRNGTGALTSAPRAWDAG